MSNQALEVTSNLLDLELAAEIDRFAELHQMLVPFQKEYDSLKKRISAKVNAKKSLLPESLYGYKYILDFGPSSESRKPYYSNDGLAVLTKGDLSCFTPSVTKFEAKLSKEDFDRAFSVELGSRKLSEIRQNYQFHNFGEFQKPIIDGFF